MEQRFCCKDNCISYRHLQLAKFGHGIIRRYDETCTLLNYSLPVIFDYLYVWFEVLMSDQQLLYLLFTATHSNCGPPTCIMVSSFYVILHILQFNPQISDKLTTTCTMSIEGKSSVNYRSLVTCMHGCVRKWLWKSTKVWFLLSSYSNSRFPKSDTLNFFLHVYDYN